MTFANKEDEVMNNLIISLGKRFQGKDSVAVGSFAALQLQGLWFDPKLLFLSVQGRHVLPCLRGRSLDPLVGVLAIG